MPPASGHTAESTSLGTAAAFRLGRGKVSLTRKLHGTVSQPHCSCMACHGTSSYRCSALVTISGCVQSLSRRWIFRCGLAACLPSCRVRLSQDSLFVHACCSVRGAFVINRCPCARHQCGMLQGAAERRRTSQSRQAIVRLWCWRRTPRWTRADLSALQSGERLPERRRRHRGAAPSNGSQRAQQVRCHCCT